MAANWNVVRSGGDLHISSCNDHHDHNCHHDHEAHDAHDQGVRKIKKSFQVKFFSSSAKLRDFLKYSTYNKIPRKAIFRDRQTDRHTDRL